MPILWRYLMRCYFQVFILCVSGFIAILLVTRFQDIARFATTGAPLGYILLFILYQIPFILPLAIPISCLIASILLFQRLSRSHELTAMRAAGMGIKPLIFPLLLSGFLLTIGNFSFISEVAPRCRLLSKSLIYEMSATNPLCLLSKDTMIKLKNSHIDMRQLKSDKFAKDVLIVQRDLSHERLGVMLAKELTVKDKDLIGKGITFISSLAPPAEAGDTYDHLVIENQGEMRIKADELLQYVRRSEWHLDEDYLSLRTILAKEKVDKGGFSWTGDGAVEIARRLSLGLAPFVFTLIGTSVGMEIGRVRKIKGLAWAIGLAGGFMIAFVAAKSMRHSPLPAIGCYLIPHPLIVLVCLGFFKKVARGIE